jgi:hypothetical protein
MLNKIRELEEQIRMNEDEKKKKEREEKERKEFEE